MRWPIYILLANVTLALTKDGRPKRDLDFIKSLIPSGLFSDSEAEVMELDQDGVKFYKVPGIDDILIKAIPKVTRPQLIIKTDPRPIINFGVQETYEVVPRPVIDVTRFVPTPIETKYSYKQHKSDGFTTTYTSKNGGDVMVTETKKMPPLPPYIRRRMQDIVVGEHPIVHQEMQFVQRAPIGPEAVFYQNPAFEPNFIAPYRVSVPNVSPAINIHHASAPYRGMVSSPFVFNYKPNVDFEKNKSLNNRVYPNALDSNLDDKIKPSAGTNSYKYKIVHKDNISTYLGSEASHTKETNTRTVAKKLSAPAMIQTKTHAVEPMNSVTNRSSFNLLPVTTKAQSASKKTPIDYVYIPPSNEIVRMSQNTIKNDSASTHYSYKQVANLNEAGKVNMSGNSNFVKAVNSTSIGQMKGDNGESFSEKPIVVLDTTYMYKQHHPDGSTTSIKGNSDNKVSVDTVSKVQLAKKGRGDIP